MAPYKRNSAYDLPPAIWNLYVVRLKDEARKNNPKSATHDNNKKNTGSCVYVGCTTLTPEARLEYHQTPRVKKNIFPDYFEFLMESKYEHHNRGKKRGLETYEQATRREEKLAKELEAKGFVVWCYFD